MLSFEVQLHLFGISQIFFTHAACKEEGSVKQNFVCVEAFASCAVQHCNAGFSVSFVLFQC